MNRYRYQIRFTKTGLLRWTSHRDLARLWERMSRRAGLPLAMSEGFSPKPRISFPSALALGVESLDEVVEVDLLEPLPADQILERLANDGVPGMEIRHVCPVPEGFGRAQFEAGHYILVIPAEAEWDPADLETRIHRLLDTESLRIVRKGRAVAADPRDQIAYLRLRDGHLELGLRGSRTASMRPQEVLDALDLGTAIDQGARLIRVRTELDRQVDLQSGATAPAVHTPSRLAGTSALPAALELAASASNDTASAAPHTGTPHKPA